MIQVLAVQGPVQFISSYIAAAWLAQTRGEVFDLSKIHCMVFDLMVGESETIELFGLIRKLATSFGIQNIVLLDSTELESCSRTRVERQKEFVYRSLGVRAVDRIFLARDFVGYGSRLLMNAFEGAEMVETGDSLGLVGNQSTFQEPSGLIIELGAFIRRLARRALLGELHAISFDATVLSLPIDWSGNYLMGKELVVPDAEFVREIFRRAIGSLTTELEEVESLRISNPKPYILLMSNLSRSGFMTEQAEISLYLSKIKEACDRGFDVIVKPHPRSPTAFIEKIHAQLATEESVIVLRGSALARLPIELWIPFMSGATVCPIFSTSAINIAYLGFGSISLELPGNLVETYSSIDKVPQVEATARIIVEAIEGLRTWNGNGVLWSKRV